MKKTTNEIKSIASEISGKYGYFLNVTEVGRVFGISRESARKLLNDIPTAELTGSKKILSLRYSQKGLQVGWIFKHK